jgi:hypothetical protein
MSEVGSLADINCEKIDQIAAQSIIVSTPRRGGS